MILENDTESRRTRTVIFTSHGKKKTVNSRMSFELGSEELLRFKRIKRESLILAQDERWRRAEHMQVERGTDGSLLLFVSSGGRVSNA